jgi:hypothetical protein
LGFRFLLSKRLSISTEASYSVQYQVEKYKTYYVPQSNQYEPKADAKTPDVKKLTSFLTQPVFFYITFDI